MITWANFVPAGRHLGRKKRNPALPGWNFSQSQDILYEEFITLPGSRKTGQNFIPANRDHLITPYFYYYWQSFSIHKIILTFSIYNVQFCGKYVEKKDIKQCLIIPKHSDIYFCLVLNDSAKILFALRELHTRLCLTTFYEVSNEKHKFPLGNGTCTKIL